MMPLALQRHAEVICKYYSYFDSIHVHGTRILALTQLQEVMLKSFNGHGLKDVLAIEICLYSQQLEATWKSFDGL
jgi:hypothetical protein